MRGRPDALLLSYVKLGTDPNLGDHVRLRGQNLNFGIPSVGAGRFWGTDYCRSIDRTSRIPTKASSNSLVWRSVSRNWITQRTRPSSSLLR